MLVNGKAFRGTVDYESTDKALRWYTGNPYISCLTQFRPIDNCPFARMVYKLLLVLHNYGLCCFLTGAYTLLVEGQIDVFDELTTVIALTETSILNWVFQKSEYSLAAHFAISVDFTFHLLSKKDTDLFLYRVSYP